MFRLLKLRNFLYLFVGETISVAGNQAYFLTLPWLILQYTGSTLALGTLLTVATVPRIVLSLLGGAVSDQLPARALMIASNVSRGIAMFGLFAVLLHGTLRMWHLYFVACFFGIVEAFFAPAYATLVPRLVKHSDLDRANTLLRSASQCVVLVAPGPFGLLVAHTGIGAAFLADGFSFVFAASTLCLVQNVRQPASALRSSRLLDRTQGFWRDVRAGLEYVWMDKAMRSVLTVYFIARMAFLGPFMVGIAALAHERLAGGIISLGVVLSVMSGGAMFGALSAARFRSYVGFSTFLSVVLVVFSVGTLLLALFQTMIAVVPIVFALGVGAGGINVIAFSWMQARSEEAFVGRVISLAMLSSALAEPLSFAIAGILASAGIIRMFVSVSITMALLSVLCRWNRDIHSLA